MNSNRHRVVITGTATAMIPALVDSAFQTGCLSVASEGLIRQVLEAKGCKATDLKALEKLYRAVQSGRIQREAHQNTQMPQLVGLERV